MAEHPWLNTPPAVAAGDDNILPVGGAEAKLERQTRLARRRRPTLATLRDHGHVDTA